MMIFRRHGFPARHWWECLLLGLIFLHHISAQADLIVYTNSLNSSWNNWSWATVSLANTAVTHSAPNSISVTANNSATDWKALYLDVSAMDVSGYTNLSFWINGGTGGQTVQVQALLNDHPQSGIQVGPLPANSWQHVNCSLSALGVAGQTTFTGFWIQGVGSSPLPTFYVDDILLQSGAPPPPNTNSLISVRVDAQAGCHPISPLIYGVAFASSNELADLNFTMNRSGGNSETRYNWQINAHNLGNDWYFESYPDDSATPGASADDHVANSKAGGAAAMISIPMIGWMPKLDGSRGILPSYSVAKYGSQADHDPYFADAGNGVTSGGADITNNDPNDANFPTNSAFQQNFVRHLTTRWGASTNGGVNYYIMDNEHSIWFSTHRDVHPAGPSMQEILGKIVDYATMVKSNDPNALVCAPEEFGWSGYFFSGADQQWSKQHNDYTVAHFPDRAANGGWDYMPWLLNQLRQHDVNTGQRLLDYFTLHCYPQGADGGDDVSPATEILRNQSTRQLWDTNYVDQSWIGQQASNNILMLIPRMKTWIGQYYPGTKIGITEYNWGAEAFMSGATAQADVLGIFGREGLDLATRWTTPATNTPTFLAMKIYRNYDGNKSAFGDTSVSASVPDPDNLSAFASIRTNDNALTVMVINKALSGVTPVRLSITNFNYSGSAVTWQLAAGKNITRLADVTIADGIVSNTLPAQSITLYVLPSDNRPSLRLGTNGTPGHFELWLDGVAGQVYVLQSSTNLTTWSPFSTNTAATNSLHYLLNSTNIGPVFFRGVSVPR